MMKQIRVHRNDLPKNVEFTKSVAVDCETLGLKIHRDRLCLVQLALENGVVHLVQFPENQEYRAPNLCSMLRNENIIKIFHYARFDIAVLRRYLGVMTSSIYCTKIASNLVRTYTNKHGLKDLLEDLLDITISKRKQSSDWSLPTLTQDQIEYAAGDVAYLHAIKKKLDYRLRRDNRLSVANAIFRFLPVRVFLDLEGWEDVDIFSHS